jgi:hypothetical protein
LHAVGIDQIGAVPVDTEAIVGNPAVDLARVVEVVSSHSWVAEDEVSGGVLCGGDQRREE